MDNLAHSLVGATLGRAVAGGRVRYTGLLGAIAGNAPDFSEFVTGDLGPGAEYLARHRGHTHSLLGAAIEAAVLVTAAWLLRRRFVSADLPARRAAVLLALVMAPALASHLLLDWTGSYGLRPLLPWSGRWYYGDVIPIVDVVFWLVPLAMLVWGSPRTWRWRVGWALLATFPTVVILTHPAAEPDIKVVWVSGLIVTALAWRPGWFGPGCAWKAGATGAAVLTLYGIGCAVGHGSAIRVARERARERLGVDARADAMTTVGTFFRWELVYSTPDSVVGESYRWPGGRIEGRTWAVARNLDLPEVRRALEDSPDGHAIAIFARFLAAEVRREGLRPVVVLRDARYARAGTGGWAVVSVPIEQASSP